MPTMVCVPCRVFFKVERNGVAFEEGFGNGEGKPYKLWHADLYQCPSCKTRVIAGLGAQAVAEHYQPEYERLRESLAPALLVDDCPGGCIHNPDPCP